MSAVTLESQLFVSTKSAMSGPIAGASAPHLLRLLVATAIVVVVVGMALSYDALAKLAREAGIDPILSWAYPAVIDGVLVVGSIAAYVLRGARLRIRMYLWLLIAAGVVVSVAGNAAHALTHGGTFALPVAASALVSAVPPASLAAVIHVLIVLMRALPETAVEETAMATEEATRPELEGDARQLSEPERAEPSPVVTRRGDTRARLGRLLRRHPEMTASTAARRLGVSRQHAARLVRELRGASLQVVEGER